MKSFHTNLITLQHHQNNYDVLGKVNKYFFQKSTFY